MWIFKKNLRTNIVLFFQTKRSNKNIIETIAVQIN